MNRRKVSLALGLIVLLPLVVGGVFAWGYLTHRDRIFPYRIGVLLAHRLDLVEAPSAELDLGRPADAAKASLTTLSYVSGTADPRAERSGVYHNDPARTFAGWNLFAPVERSRAFLLGMDGRVVHRWSAPYGPWQHVTPLADGELLVLVEDERLFRLDQRSHILWSRRSRFHHDLSVDRVGRIYVLERTHELRPEIHPRAETIVDWVSVLSPDGEVLRRTSLLDLILRSPYAFILPELRQRPTQPVPHPLDVLHANHVEVFDGRLAKRSPLYAKGNLLISLRTPSTILITDPEAERILWLWGPGNLVFQHHPSLLDNGHLLVFDNGMESSRVLEVDPLNRRIVWQYRAPGFYSATRGSAQRLPNGNTLITESDTGYVFEVTPTGDRVWAFADPVFTDDGKRMAIWRMSRLPPDDPRLPPDLDGRP